MGTPPSEEPSSRTLEEPRSIDTISNSTSAEGIVSTAQNFLGGAYVSGGTSPSGFDCSGFTQYVYKQNGITIARTSSAQANNGTPVSRENLQPGDLVYFNNGAGGSIGHVGIYVGNGQFIHAANANRGIVYDTIESGYYSTYYAGARRM